MTTAVVKRRRGGGQVDELESDVGLRVGGIARVGAGAARAGLVD